MVDLSSRLDEVRRMVDNGDYFVINRARQYGKTTILRALSVCLQDMYRVIFIDFQRMSTEDYADEYAFSTAFGDSVYKFFP
jgi:predicted AAA+ superfamily ATPase